MSRLSGLRVGYVRAGRGAQDASARLGPHCEAIRSDPHADQPGGGLQAVLGFLRRGDLLVVQNVQSLGDASGALQALEAIMRRGAALQVLDPPFTAEGEAARALAAGLALAAPKRPASEAEHGDVAHALHAAGLGPTEIARRLGVSRMTVWRRLRRPQPV